MEEEVELRSTKSSCAGPHLIENFVIQNRFAEISTGSKARVLAQRAQMRLGIADLCQLCCAQL